MTRSRPRSYQSLHQYERNPVPESLRRQAGVDLGNEPLTVRRYLDREFHQLEKEKLWPRVWQAVCRETEVAQAGDFYVHDIAGFSVLLVRGEDRQLRAFPNACLHRGRQLKTGNDAGRRTSSELRCAYHGFRWQLDGQFLAAPCEWDFPHIDKAGFNLPQLRLETWGGWVFVNRDPGAPSLLEIMGEMAAHFQRWQPECCYKALHIRKVVRCNWKLAHEAFIESYHTVATHPQLLLYTGDANSQYDYFNDHVSRTITPMGVASPNLHAATEQASVHQWLAIYGVDREIGLPDLPENKSAREFLGELNIRRFSALYQMDLSSVATHGEVLDAILYSIFPNFAPWAGFRPNVTYRFLPWQDRHDMCTMDIMLLTRFPPGSPRPADAPVQFVEADRKLCDVPGIDPGLATVFDQDFSNLPMVQKGLATLESGEVQLANYQERRIRHFHRTLDKYLLNP
jgi:phenylpropionate dioxygenase-like ring-hydroxylating dioxygenase large terminal subunit